MKFRKSSHPGRRLTQAGLCSGVILVLLLGTSECALGQGNRKLREIYRDEYFFNDDYPNLRFIDPAGRYMAVAAPTSKNSPTAGWEIRIVDVDAKRTLSRRRFEPENLDSCMGGFGWMEIAKQDGETRVWFRQCDGKIASMTIPDLGLAEELTADGEMPEGPLLDIAVASEEEGKRSPSALVVGAGSRRWECRLHAPESPDPEMSANFTRGIVSPNGQLVAGFFSYARPAAPEQTAFAERIGLVVYELGDCRQSASHVFRVGWDHSPSSFRGKFAGPSWSWWVEGANLDSYFSSRIRIWDWKAGKVIAEWKGRRGASTVLDVSSDGRYVILRGDDEPDRPFMWRMRDFSIWDLEARKMLAESPAYSRKELLKKLEGEQMIGGVDHPDGPPSLNYLFDWLSDVMFSLDGSRILHASAGRITVYSWSAKDK